MPLNKPAKDGNAGQVVTGFSENPLAFSKVVREQFDRPMPQTLGDVITSMQKSEERLSKRKMTFEEWWSCNRQYYERSTYQGMAEGIWKAAQENV
jgi:hypothetical protein